MRANIAVLCVCFQTRGFPDSGRNLACWGSLWTNAPRGLAVGHGGVGRAQRQGLVLCAAPLCGTAPSLFPPPACFSGLVWFGFAKHCCFRFLYNSGACVQKGQLQVKPGSFIFFSNLVCRQALSCRDKANLGILKKMLENVRNNYWILAFGSLLFM